jgi:hypothetical protein
MGSSKKFPKVLYMSTHTTHLLVAVAYQDEDPVRHPLGIQVPGLIVKVHCGADGDLPATCTSSPVV